MDAGNGAEQRNGGKASVSGADPAPLPREAPSDHAKIQADWLESCLGLADPDKKNDEE